MAKPKDVFVIQKKTLINIVFHFPAHNTISTHPDMTSLWEQAQGISKHSHNDKMLPPHQTFILIFDSTIPALKYVFLNTFGNY